MARCSAGAPTIYMRASFALLCALLALCRLASAQLPNLRVGLPADVDPGRQLWSQRGYGLRDHDLPFGERYEVRLKYYKLPVQPLYYRNTPPAKVACCYSFNAYWTANVALHPYWFKQFGLERMCRQDVCLSVWLKDHSHDLMFKVTDVCDPKDCPTPFDIKVEPYKGRYLWRMGPNENPYYLPQGPVDMYFVKCWADGMPQPDMVNALPGPALQNSRHWMITNTEMQWKKNQAWNKQHGKATKPLGMLVRPEATQRWLDDFKQGEWPPGSQSRIAAQYGKKC